jgi:membrane protein implicated in regulation of membrane protease activity
MAGDFISDWAWVFWLALILIFAIIEVNTLDLTFLMLALGSVGGLISGLLGAEWWLQILAAAVTALVLLFFVRPPLLRALRRGGDPTRSNVDALTGLGGTVVVAFDDGRGQVKLANGETWTSRLAAGSSGSELHEGDKVVVASIDGATAVVIPSIPDERPTA